MLQCSNSCCQKWRRVDGCTQELFSNKTWLRDRLADEERELYEQCHDYDAHVRRWLAREGTSESLAAVDYEEFLAGLPAALGATLSEAAPHARAWAWEWCSATMRTGQTLEGDCARALLSFA